MDLVLPVLPDIITEVMAELCFLYPYKANKGVAQWDSQLPRDLSLGPTLLHVLVVLTYVPVSAFTPAQRVQPP